MKKIYSLLIVLSTLFIGCDKYLDIEPKGKVIPKTTEDFRQLLNSGYRAVLTYKSDIVAFCGDELIANENSGDFPKYKTHFAWERLSTDTDKQTLEIPYIEFYQSIFYANETLYSGSEKMPASEEKDQILAEAYALRAYNYFSLINLYAKPYDKATASTDIGVPLVLKIDLEQEFPKVSVQKIYDQIVSDIKEADALMYLPIQQKGLNYRFSKASLYALASRVYLYMKEYQKSIEFADKSLQINNSLIDLNKNLIIPSVFDTTESLLALERTFSNEAQNASFASEELLSWYDKNSDLRFGLYLSKNSNDKYTILKAGNSKFRCSFRTAELYLNKAESLARLTNELQAKETLFTLLENRYKTTDFSLVKTKIMNLSADKLISEILLERARELAFEGHRWFDLRRTNQKEITHTIGGKTYTLKVNDPRYTFPFPKEAIQNNIHL